MKGDLVRRAELSPSERDEMFALLDAHFEGVARERFEEDLEAKHWVVRLTRPDGALVGFSTIHFACVDCAGEKISVVCSGDTIVAREAWGSPVLPRSWIEAVYRIHREEGRGPLWWLLITSGYRTYRFLPVFWREFHPRFDAATPPSIERRLHLLAASRYGPAFDAASGVVRFAQPQRLRQGVGDVTDERLRDPHVAFFVARNPGHAAGDELVALTSLDRTNLTAAGRRMVAGGSGGAKSDPEPA